MSSDSDARRLSRLRAELNSSLLSLMHRTSSSLPRGGNRPQVARAHGGSAGVVPAMTEWPTGPVPDAVRVSVDLKGGAIFLDDERRVRALAKEIKRLITEDNRRGIGL